jgi:hypothetical protein
LADVIAQALERRRFRAALGAARDMLVEKRPLGLGNFAIEIGVDPRAHLLTLHRPHPFRCKARRSDDARCSGEIMP